MLNNDIKVSIVIVSWNAKKYLTQCIESIDKQIEKIKAEVIVVDNNSNDGSADAVEMKFPRVKIIRCNENYGFAKANNIGIGISRGDFICLINSDVLLRQGCVSRLLEYMESHADIGILGPRTLNADGTLQKSCFSLPSIWNSLCRVSALDSVFPWSRIFGRRLMTYWAHNEIRNVEALNGCFLLVRRTALEEVGLLDELFFMYGEDLDWCKRFGDCGWGVVYFPEAEAVHFGGASSSNAPLRFFIEMNRADLQYWRKHKGIIGEGICLMMLVLHHSFRVAGYSILSIFITSMREVSSVKLKNSCQCLRWLFSREIFAGVSAK